MGQRQAAGVKKGGASAHTVHGGAARARSAGQRRHRAAAHRHRPNDAIGRVRDVQCINSGAVGQVGGLFEARHSSHAIVVATGGRCRRHAAAAQLPSQCAHLPAASHNADGMVEGVRHKDRAAVGMQRQAVGTIKGGHASRAIDVGLRLRARAGQRGQLPPPQHAQPVARQHAPKVAHNQRATGIVHQACWVAQLRARQRRAVGAAARGVARQRAHCAAAQVQAAHQVVELVREDHRGARR